MKVGEGFTKPTEIQSKIFINSGKSSVTVNQEKRPTLVEKTIFVKAQDSHQVPGQGIHHIKDHYEKPYKSL